MSAPRPPRAPAPPPLPPRPGPHPPADPAAVRSAGRTAGRFGLLSLAAVVAAQLPLPWGLAGLVFMVAAVVVGIVALVAAVRARMGASSVVLLSVGLAVVSFVLLLQLVRVVFYPVSSADERCRSAAVTEQGLEACAQQAQEGVWEQFFGG